jgi:hypothetical protein
VDLPVIDDSTVTVLAEEASHHRQESVLCFGDARKGSDAVWDELILATIAELRAAEAIAELRAVEEAKAQVDDEVIIKALTKIEDDEIRNVITQMDKEQQIRNLRDRAKRSASYKEKPPVRAQTEPFFVEFTMMNPLGIPIDLADLQLVAKMTDHDGERVCTNEDAIFITPLVSYNEIPKWAFHSTKEEFRVADFCRISSGSGRGEKEKWKSGEEATPFFVVTKASITLEPESRTTASLGICPLEQGNLEILGVRFRLFDDVWLYHRFEIKGPLLQNTRSNRANRVRGEPMLLKAKVERGMPCLTAELLSPKPTEHETGPALQGQIRKWTLRITNIGTAASAAATLKTNVPWMHLALAVADPGRNDSTSRCIGPSGTLMSLPIESPNLKKNGQLEPGESIDIPVEIRTSGAGKQDFYMLFRYELPKENDRDKAPRCRWLKKMFEVPVYPSLTLSASIVPSYLNHGEHILSVELTNNRTDSPDNLKLLLEKLTLASWRYRLERIGGQLGTAHSESVELGWQERVTAHYRVVAVDADVDDNISLLSECQFSEVNTQPGNNGSTSLLTFLSLERAHEQFEETVASHKIALARAAAAQDAKSQHPRSIAQIRRANTESTGLDSLEMDLSDVVHPTSITRLCPRDKDNEHIHIVCSWNGEDPTLRGEHHIRGLGVRPLEKTRGCPITVAADHPSCVSNDFTKGPATVPFSITLRNRLVKTPVTFEFSIDGSESFDLSGVECFKTNLEGGQELSIPMRALIPSVGVYNLQRVRLTVDKGQWVSFLFPLQWLVSVTDQ